MDTRYAGCSHNFIGYSITFQKTIMLNWKKSFSIAQVQQNSFNPTSDTQKILIIWHLRTVFPTPESFANHFLPVCVMTA